MKTIQAQVPDYLAQLAADAAVKEKTLEFAAWTREMNDSDVNCEPHSVAAG